MQERLTKHSFLPALALLAPLAQAETPVDPIAEALDVRNYEVVPIAVPTEPGIDVELSLTIEGQPILLELERHSMRSDQYQVLLQLADGSWEGFDAPVPSTFRGQAAGVEDSLVAGSLVDGQLSAILRTDFGTWGIQPLSLVDPTAPAHLHVVYEQKDLLDRGWTCGVPDGAITPVQGGQTFGTGLALTEIAFDADVEYYNDLGSSAVNVVNDIENITNIMSGIYETDVNIIFEITTILIRTSNPDPYTSSDAGGLLNQFDSEWSNNQSFIQRDIAHLMTGRNINGGTIGIAYLNAICSSGIGYGLSESTFTSNLSFRVGLTAHEVGHNYGAGHCDGTPTGACRIMCSGLGGCNNNVTSFGLLSRNSITSFSNSINCNPELATALTLPFSEDFNGPGIPRELWPVRQGTSLSNAALNEPSGNSSLNMDAAGNQVGADDFIRSNVILMGGASGQELAFFTQHRGVEAGESLIVEYLNSGDDWVFLYEVVSNGVDQSTFVEHNVSLPAGAYHNGFRFRFVANVNASNDDWYIDDVRIDDGFPCSAPQNYCSTAPNSASPFGATIGFSGDFSVAANDFTLNALQAPANQVGIFYYGPTQLQQVFGNGFRCVGGQTVRLPIISTDIFGFAFFDLDLNNLPPGSVINPGDTTNFQFWFRDPAAGGAAFNLTDGLSVTWCP